jgi:DNA-binding response OmpR family regulator
MSTKILLIEDDASIMDMVQSYLVKEGFAVAKASDGEAGIEVFGNDVFDLVIVDMMMPKLDGLEVIKIIRERSSIPILIMSAKDSDVDKALGLGFGADDYIAKPFSLIELTARVKALIRRATKYSILDDQKANHQVIVVDQLRIDEANFTVTKHNNHIKLTSKEFDLLKLFASYPGRVFTKAQLYNLIWNDEYYGDENVINVHIRRLREKIEDNPSQPKHVKTLWGIGYRWEN